MPGVMAGKFAAVVGLGLGLAAVAWSAEAGAFCNYTATCNGHPECCEKTCSDTCCFAHGSPGCPCEAKECACPCESCNGACSGPPPNTCTTPALTEADIKKILTGAGLQEVSLLGGAGAVPVATKFANGPNWNMLVSLSASDGLTVSEVALGGRTMARQVSAPYLKLRLFGSDEAAPRCELKTGAGPFDACDGAIDGFWGRGKVKLVGFGVFAGKGGADGTVESLHVHADWEVAPATPDPDACLWIAQDYAFTAQDPRGCETSDTLPCWRFYPTMAFRYTPRQGAPKAIGVRMPQRMVFAPSGSGKGAMVFLSDGRSLVPSINLSPSSPLFTITTPYLGNPLPKETHKKVIAQGQVVPEPTLAPWLGLGFDRSIDNMHWSCAADVSEPGSGLNTTNPKCSLFFEKPGCPECVHMHWNWTAINSYTQKLNVFCPETGKQYNFGNPLIPDGSTQDVDIAEVALHLGEEDPADYRALADDNEDLADKDKVFWYEGISVAASDSFLNGGSSGVFFNPKDSVCNLGATSSPLESAPGAAPGLSSSTKPRSDDSWLLLFTVAYLTRLRRLRIGARVLPAAALASILLACTPRASVDGVAPGVLYRGRATEIVFSGSSFRDDTPVAASGGARVSGVRAVSPNELHAVVFVAVDSPESSLELTVDGRSAATVPLADALRLGASPAQLQQGRHAKLLLQNLDPAHPTGDDAGASAGDGVIGGGVDAAGGILTLGLYALPKAKVGTRDLTVTLGEPALGGAAALVRGAVVVQPREPNPILPNVDKATAIPADEPGVTLDLGGATGKLVDLRLIAPPKGSSGAIPAIVELLDPDKGLLQPLVYSYGGELLAQPALDPQVFVGLRAGPIGTDAALTVNATVVAATTANESEDNGTVAQANAIALPAVVGASLGGATDVDCFKLTAAKGTLVVRTVSDGATDTRIQLLDANQVEIAANDDEAPNTPTSFLVAPINGGTVFVRVSRGREAYKAGGSYRLMALVR